MFDTTSRQATDQTSMGGFAVGDSVTWQSSKGQRQGTILSFYTDGYAFIRTPDRAKTINIDRLERVS